MISGWSIFTMGSCFFILKKLDMLRIAAVEEQQGMDVSYHGGSAYPDAKETATDVFSEDGQKNV